MQLIRKYHYILFLKSPKRKLQNCIEWAMFHLLILIGSIIGASIHTWDLVPIIVIIGACKITIISWLITAPFIWFTNPDRLLFQSMRE